jgi:SAM-dependent methyltransferase
VLARRGTKFPNNVFYGDIVKGLPVANESCNAIYCSHILEHLSLDELRIALRNTFNHLKTGGVFRFVLPDLDRIARDYLASDSRQPSVDFMIEAHLGRETQINGLIRSLRDWLGKNKHLWMWDFRSMQVELERVGFTEIRRAAFGDAEDMRFREVENKQRWHRALGIECKKPHAL